MPLSCHKSIHFYFGGVCKEMSSRGHNAQSLLINGPQPWLEFTLPAEAGLFTINRTGGIWECPLALSAELPQMDYIKASRGLGLCLCTSPSMHLTGQPASQHCHPAGQ